MTTFVALGDSITLGVGDRQPGGSWRGWAELLAAGLPQPEFHNLAVAGAQTADVRHSQLPRALELRPDLAAVVVGVNDTLRRTFDPARTAAAAEQTLGALRAAGAVVLTMRLPDPGRMLGLPPALAQPIARRIAAVNDVVDTLADRYATVHFDAAGSPETYERHMWSVDRLHPGERGHRLVACAYYDLLRAAGFPLAGRPDPVPSGKPPTRWAQWRWMATEGTGWALRRCTDLVPFLLGSVLRDLRRRALPPPATAPAPGWPPPAAEQRAGGGPGPERNRGRAGPASRSSGPAR